MSWELTIKTPDGAVQKAVYTNAAPAGIFGEFRWSVDDAGSPKQFIFHAKPSSVDIGPRDLVFLKVDGSPAFAGFVVKSHPSNDASGREYLALGLKQLLRSLYVPWTHYPYQDTGSGIFNKLGLAVADALPINYVAGSAPETGWKLEAVYPGTVDYHTALEDVVRRTPGYIWGVDVTGTLFMRRPASVMEVPYSAPGVRWLPVMSDDVVTKVIGWAGYYSHDGHDAHEYRDGVLYAHESIYTKGKWPLVALMAQSDEHAVYAAEKAFAVATTKEDTNDVLRRLHREGRIAVWPRATNACSWCLCNNPSNFDALFDGNNNTYIEIGINESGMGQVYITDPDVVGAPEYSTGNIFPYPPAPRGFWPLEVKLRFRLPNTDTQVSVGGHYVSPELAGSTYGWGIHGWSSGMTAGEDHTISMKDLPPLTMSLDFQLITVGYWCRTVRIYSFEATGIVIYDMAALGNSLLRPPHQQAAEVIVDGYKPPTDYLRISGAPGGDVYSRAGEIEYVWSPEAQVTTFRSRQRQPESASAIVQAAERARMGATIDGSIAMRR